MYLLIMIKLLDLLFEVDSWDDYDIDIRTGKLIPKASVAVKPKQEPDEPEGGVLGKYVFGDIRKDLGQNIEQEADTQLEKDIYNALVFYASFNTKANLNRVALKMKEISDSGKYREYFSVPSTTAWRVLIDISKSNLENILGKEINKDLGVESSGIIAPRSDSSFTGWTLDPKATIKIYSQARFESVSKESSEGYIVLAKCETTSNDFFFNVDAAMKYISVGGSPYDYQKEVLAYGNVNASGVAYMKKKDIKHNPVQELLKLLM